MGKRVMGCSILVLGLAILGLIGNPVNAISCTEAVTRLLPCQTFLLGSGGITPSCCQAAAALNQIAASKPERTSLCQCFERVAPAMGVNYGNAKQLPTLCKINTPVPIDPSVDCNKV